VLNKIEFSKKFILIFFLGMHLQEMIAQDTLHPKYNIHLGYGAQWPIASDLTKRYGQHGILSLGMHYIHKNWETGPWCYFLFGSRVKEDVLSSLRSADGELIGSDHQLAVVDLKMRGTLIGWSIGRTFRLNRESMILIHVQPGWLTHWIKFQNPGSTFEPIQGDYRYGYDRLSSGLAWTEGITYRYQSSNHLINFEIAALITESKSLLQRNIQFGSPGIQKNISSILIGLQGRWLIPVFPKKNADHIYY
jgi:hypothetical protein